MLSEIWEQVLGVERAGIYDNFFELGGDSIFSIQVVAKAEDCGLPLSIPGLALALVLLAGAGGNAVNAFLRSSDYVSLGASTAVFAAVGLLSGLGVVRRMQRGDRWRLALLPFAGGLGILAMVGSGGGRVDVFAHLFGLLVGTALGLGVALVVAGPPRPWVQVVSGVGAVLVVLGSWRLAL
jgi:hypothetical protein